MNPNFPMHLWDKTIPQAELTLNLLRQSRLNPKLSAWKQLHGRYDFNSTPIAPPGIKVKAHVQPIQRQTWAPHTHLMLGTQALPWSTTTAIPSGPPKHDNYKQLTSSYGSPNGSSCTLTTSICYAQQWKTPLCPQLEGWSTSGFQWDAKAGLATVVADSQMAGSQST